MSFQSMSVEKYTHGSLWNKNSNLGSLSAPATWWAFVCPAGTATSAQLWPFATAILPWSVSTLGNLLWQLYSKEHWEEEWISVWIFFLLKTFVQVNLPCQEDRLAIIISNARFKNKAVFHTERKAWFKNTLGKICPLMYVSEINHY